MGVDENLFILFKILITGKVLGFTESKSKFLIYSYAIYSIRKWLAYENINSWRYI